MSLMQLPPLLLLLLLLLFYVISLVCLTAVRV